jgi:CRISPR type III-B/RAMP module RAMP protein Cmr1
MIPQTYTIEIITPCFCGGAEPSQRAEIRAPSIRGQLRWWFRVLGGFKSLAPMPVREQEAMIFGETAGDSGKAGKLTLRVKSINIQSSQKDADKLGHQRFSDSAYLTFPLESRPPKQEGGRGVLLSGKFELSLIWRGSPSLAPCLQALVAAFTNLGSLGFRSRRAMGALAPVCQRLPSTGWQNHFQQPNGIVVKSMSANSSTDAISKLGSWLRRWRSHGRSQDHDSNQNDFLKPPLNCGFDYAKRDHDIGYGLPDVRSKPAYRPALGLPIIQRTSKGTKNWEYGKGNPQEPKGRFASPVILRPHKDFEGKWHALVIFVEARQWPVGKQVFINGQPHTVSLDLFIAMKDDAPGYLKPFP